MRGVRILLASLVTAGVGVVAACSVGGYCDSTPPCPAPFVHVYSPCGVKSITSTCSGFARADAGACTSDCSYAIRGAGGETCTIDVVHGNGATTSATVTFQSDECCGVHPTRATSRVTAPAGCNLPDASTTDGAPD